MNILGYSTPNESFSLLREVRHRDVMSILDWSIAGDWNFAEHLYNLLATIAHQDDFYKPNPMQSTCLNA